MHLPDGLLTTNVWVSAWVFSILWLGYCLKKAKKYLRDKTIPLMGVSSAFIFAAQMFNFPAGPGVSGHLLGGVLAAVLLGPYLGAIVIAVVLIAQCLILQDGGITALGANILNMSFACVISGYLSYLIICSCVKNNKGIVIGAGLGGLVSIVSASFICSLELASSKIAPLQAILPAMLGIHSLIGLAEAIITGLIISFILKVRPDLMYQQAEGSY